MRYRAQIFGGRGGGSGRGGGGWSDSEVGATPAKFMYNGAKRKTGGEDGYVKNSKYENGLRDIDGGKTTAEQFASQFKRAKSSTKYTITLLIKAQASMQRLDSSRVLMN